MILEDHIFLLKSPVNHANDSHSNQQVLMFVRVPVLLVVLDSKVAGE